MFDQPQLPGWFHPYSACSILSGVSWESFAFWDCSKYFSIGLFSRKQETYGILSLYYAISCLRQDKRIVGIDFRHLSFAVRRTKKAELPHENNTKYFTDKIFLAFTKTHDQAVLWEGKRGEKLKRCREKFHYSYFKRYWRYSQCLNSLKSQYLQVLAR